MKEVIENSIVIVQEMLTKEKLHLAYLEANNALSFMIDDSHYFISHFTERLAAYKKYINL